MAWSKSGAGLIVLARLHANPSTEDVPKDGRGGSLKTISTTRFPASFKGANPIRGVQRGVS